MPPIEFAYFTPKTKTGRAHWIDFWNADLFDGDSHLTSLHAGDQIRFRTDATTWSGSTGVGNPNGFVQAGFDMPQTDYFLGIVKLSGGPAAVRIKVDTTDFGLFWVEGVGVEIPVVLELARGFHWITVIQRHVPANWGYKHIWFHSITCFLI